MIVEDMSARLPAVMLVAMFILMSGCGDVSSDPDDSSMSDGIRVASWDFGTPADYALTNVALETGAAELSLLEASWIQSSNLDFITNGTEILNLTVFPAGHIALELPAPQDLLQNGNFSSPLGVGGSADYWNYHQVDPSFPLSLVPQRDDQGGLPDFTKHCWNTTFMDPHPAVGSHGVLSLNQTFNLPSVPFSMNLSVFYNFINTSYATPGTIAEMHVTNLGNNVTSNLTSTGWVNSSYAGYKQMWYEGTDIFSEPGSYNLTLFTNMSSEGAAIDMPTMSSYWDNASVLFSAYRSHGTYTSKVFDAGSFAIWKNISWEENLPMGTDIELFVRTGNSSVPTDSIWSDWTPTLTDPSGSDIHRPRGQYLQFRAELSTTYTNLTPVLDSVNISFDKYSLEGSIETNDFSPVELVSWGFFRHEEVLNGQHVGYQYSTNSGADWTDIPEDNDLRELPVGSGTISFRALLATTDTVTTPSVTLMEVDYVSINPAFVIEPVWSSTAASPGETVRLFIHFNNTMTGSASTAWLNVYLDAGLEYIANNTQSLGIFQDFIPDSNPGVQRYMFSDIPNGNNLLWIDALVKPGMLDGDMLQTTVTLEYNGPLGKRVESFLRQAPLRVDGPVISAELVTLNNTADVGEQLDYAIYVNNTGQGKATSVWLNCTLDDRLEGNNLSIELADVPGNSSRVLFFNATLRENVVQGSSVSTSISFDYSDTAGFIFSGSTNPEVITAMLRSRFNLLIISQTGSVNSSEMLVLTVHFNNTGYGSAEMVRLEMNIPATLEFISSSEEYIIFDHTCRWEIEDIGPGTHSFTLTLRAKKTGERITETAPFQIWMQVDDPVDGTRAWVSSNSLSLSIVRVYTFWEKIHWPWSGLGAALGLSFALFGLWYFLKPIPPSIYDAFVLYRDGRLISHRIAKGKEESELDGDLVGAMLTAVQEFISDSLSEGREGKVKKLEFGDKELYLERGHNINIALIYTGSMNKKLQAQVQELVSSIEMAHPELERWSGRMTTLSDINDSVDGLVNTWQSENSG